MSGAVQLDNSGNKVILPSLRADGSIRKAIIIRQGYTAPEDMKLYVPSSSKRTIPTLSYNNGSSFIAQLANNNGIHQPTAPQLATLNKNQKRNLKKSIAKQSTNNAILLNELESVINPLPVNSNMKHDRDLESRHDEILKIAECQTDQSDIQPDSTITIQTKDSAQKQIKKIQKKLRQVEELKREKLVSCLLPEQEEKIRIAIMLEEEMNKLCRTFDIVL